MNYPHVEVEYIIKQKDRPMTYSICYSPESAIQKWQEAGKDTHEVIRKTTTYQRVLFGSST